MQSYVIKTALVSVLCIAALDLSGCQRFKSARAEDKKPAKLVKIDNAISVLTPVTAISLPKGNARIKKGEYKKADTPDLQIAVSKDGFIAANRFGVVSAYQNNTPIWSVNVNGLITSGVGMDDLGELAVVGTRDGNVIAIDTKTHEIRWQKSLPSSSITPALVDDNRVMVSTNDGVIYALDTKTGEQIWQFNTQTPLVSVRGIATPLALDKNTAVFGTADGRIHAINPELGKPLWTRRIGFAVGGSQVNRMGDVDGTPLVVGHHLYAASYSGQLSAFDMTTGQTIFTAKLASTKALTALGSLLIGSDIEGNVVAFDRITGQEQWKNSQLKYRKLTNPVAIGSYIAVGDAMGAIHILDDAGKIVGRTQVKGQLISLHVKNGQLYTQTTDNKIMIWQFK